MRWLAISLVLVTGCEAVPYVPMFSPVKAHVQVVRPKPAFVQTIQISETVIQEIAAERKPKTQIFMVSAYCPCARCCGRRAIGLTATEESAWRPGVAADWGVLKPGTKVTIPGYGVAIVDDKGGKIKGNRLDVRMTYHWQARQWGIQWLEVEIEG
jgi:3D (Asp-Asp-Asp) domain-containing protein